MMLTFNNDPKVKEFYINRIKAHQAADEIIKGQYWEKGKGCAIGCTLHSDSHKEYETKLGIPMILARLEDRIFEGMSNEKAKEFPLQFLQAVPVGVDLKDVYKKFFIWMLTDVEYGVIRFAKKENVRKVIQDVSDLLQKSLLENVIEKQFIKVKKAAAAAVADADADADAAYSAAAAATYAAVYAAYAVAYAADAAYAAAYAHAAADAARQNHYHIMSRKLIQIISETI